ncbi:MBL fold metallo-hydrolase [Motilibacter aurantiacus]|uniref:MBL fold metallo-hydrolase n=1 Tax=Motilibacter aurantiacus TaxID=2714955 RepID=UPI001407A584|nr:MBL fold metallo-hydrolase [Motilibacter aurantiacus]
MHDQPDSSLFFVGTATTVLRRDGFTVVTDPNFLRRGQRAYLGKGLSSRRLTDPAIAVEDLPVLDAVALSHLHGDHYDRAARRGIHPSVPVVTTAHGAKRLRRQGVTTAGLSTWQPWELTKGGSTLRVTALPGRHAPGPMQAALPSVMGMLIEFEPVGGGRPYRIYETGDTLVIDDLKEVVRRFPDIDMALLHLGGTKVLGVTVTMDGRMGADLIELLELGRRSRIVPIHYDDYGVFKSPLEDFRAEVDRRGLVADIRYVARGDTLPLD